MEKKIIIIISILLLCIGIILSMVFKLNNLEVKNEEINKIEEVPKDHEEIKTQKIISAVEMVRVKNCINKYINTANINNSVYYGYDEKRNQVKTVSDEEIKEKIYNLLSQKYIKKNNITNDNIFSYIDEITQNVLFDIVDMKYYENSNSNQYVVFGIIQDLQNNLIKEVYYIVNINEENNIFSIEPLLNNKTDLEEINAEDTLIERNTENGVRTTDVTQDNICKEYFNTYKRILLGKPELAYNFLDERYKQIKFGNVNNFTKYINEKKEELKKIRLEKYNIEELEDCTQYTLIDQYDNYFIINETGFMKYKVMIDNYTIGISEVEKKYETSDNLEKAQLNITKFFTAINNQEYIYAYNRLDEIFKNSNFPTISEFEDYIKTNFYKNNEIYCNKSRQEGDLYIFEIEITNSENKMEKTSKTFIIKVLEEFDFVMSFNNEK